MIIPKQRANRIDNPQAKGQSIESIQSKYNNTFNEFNKICGIHTINGVDTINGVNTITMASSNHGKCNSIPNEGFGGQSIIHLGVKTLQFIYDLRGQIQSIQ